MKRYHRQIILSELGLAGQDKLKLARVLVVGAGGLGCPVLLYLAGAGTGHIGVIDDDIVDESNLHRQILFNMTDIGCSKSEVAVKKLRHLNPYICIEGYNYRLTAQNAKSLFLQYDLIIDGSDNFATKYLINDSCVALNKPLVWGSIFQFEGQLSVFNYKNGPDYRCLYPEAPSADETSNCSDSGVIGPLPGIIGSMMGNEAIKIICGFGEVLSGKLLRFNALNNIVDLLNINSGRNTNTSQNTSPTSASDNVTNVNRIELETWDEAQVTYTLIDVREEYEFEEYNLGGINIPLYELTSRISEILKAKTIVLYCSTGRRSRIAHQLIMKRFNGKVYILEDR